MNMLSPYEKYKQQSIMVATPGELTLMLYDGCIKFLKQARHHIENKDIQEAHNNLIKASNIISELMSTLNMSYSIAEQMLSLYVYVFNEISEINLKKDAVRLEPVIEIVQDFRDTWKQAIQIDRSQRYVD